MSDNDADVAKLFFQGSPENTTSGVNDFLRERNKRDPAEITQAEESEALRHQEILSTTCAGLLLILLKAPRRYAPEHFAFLTQVAADANGALVILKYLNQENGRWNDPKSILPVPPVLPCLRAAMDAGQELPIALCFWQACGTLRVLEILYLIAKDCPHLIKNYLVNYRSTWIFKRLNRVESPRAQRLMLKMAKKQVRHLPRKWRHANMKVVSALYLQLTMSPLEDWLLNEPMLEHSMEGPFAKEFPCGVGRSCVDSQPEDQRTWHGPTDDVLGYALSFPEFVPS